MRQIGTLADEQAAHRLADHLLTLHIETRLDREADGWAVWVCDEDRVAQAREELAAFVANPGDPRYAAAGQIAGALRRQERRLDDAFVQRQVRVRERWDGGTRAPAVLTFALIVVSVAVAVASDFGERSTGLLQQLHIASYKRSGNRIRWDYLSEVRQGEVWRLVTPIFIHFGVIHLVFNMFMLYSLGRQVEGRHGTLAFGLMVLALAVSSNLAQYYLGFKFVDGWPVIQANPLFGGMSGVLYGLFGYLWMKGRYDPASGLGVDGTTVFIMMGWFVLCLLEIIPNVANVAHAAGLLGGVLLGLASAFLGRRMRRPG